MDALQATMGVASALHAVSTDPPMHPMALLDETKGEFSREPIY